MPVADGTEPVRRKNIRRYLTTEFYLFLFLLLLLAFLRVFAGGFYTQNNVMSMLNTFSYMLIASIGMNLIIITSNIDVSTGALISAVCITLAAVGKLGVGIWGLLPVAMLAGMALSFVNALFITKMKIPAIVATLATSQIFAGVLPLVVAGSIYDLPASFTWLSFDAKIHGFPASVPMMLIIAAVAMLFMRFSKFSKKLYAVGNNMEGARLAGIDVNRVIIRAYVIAGALFGITATIIATASQRVTTTMGSGMEMKFIAAVVLGGTSISGGSGKISGTIIGALILAIIAPATNYLGISSDWSNAIMGAIIIVAVVIAAMRYVRVRNSREAAAAPVKEGGRV